MGANYNLVIYTDESFIKWCRKCTNGERIRSAHIFSKEAYLCLVKVKQMNVGCTSFKESKPISKVQIAALNTIMATGIKYDEIVKTVFEYYHVIIPLIDNLSHKEASTIIKYWNAKFERINKRSEII